MQISRRELSDALEISLSTVAMYFNGYHKIRKVVALAMQTVYGISANWLLYDNPPVFIKRGETNLEEDAVKVATTYSTLPKKHQHVVKTVIEALKNSN